MKSYYLELCYSEHIINLEGITLLQLSTPHSFHSVLYILLSSLQKCPTIFFAAEVDRLHWLPVHALKPSILVSVSKHATHQTTTSLVKHLLKLPNIRIYLHHQDKCVLWVQLWEHVLVHSMHVTYSVLWRYPHKKTQVYCLCVVSILEI